jgi:hypothetical protein
MRLEGLSKLKKFSDLIGTRTNGLPACTLVSYPTTLQRVPIYTTVRGKVNVPATVYRMKTIMTLDLRAFEELLFEL